MSAINILSSTFIAGAVSLMGLFATTLPSFAVTIGYSVLDEDANLYSIDLETGAATAIGPVGFDSVEALAFQPKTGTLFGFDETTNQLITINPLTGAGTAVGTLGFITDDPGLTFDPSGNLFLANEENSLAFYSVNPTTGAGTFIGNLGEEVKALTYRNGTIYGLADGSDSLVTVNPATGVATQVGSLNLGIDIGDTGLDFSPNGTLFGIEENGAIFTVNPNTGAATSVASTLVGFKSLATVTPQNVPEPASTLGLLAFGAFGAGSIFKRKKQQKATVKKA